MAKDPLKAKYGNETIIGRDREIYEIESILASPKAEFLAVYGRRRVGKTYLIKEYFNHQFDYYLTGTANQDTAYQLNNFHEVLKLHDSKTIYDNPPIDWQEAFYRLRDYCTRLPTDRKTVLFFDELPWLDTPKSDFLSGLEYFWNSYASTNYNIVLIGCGSAASWMINELINNKGGLHNRVTHRIQLLPFHLHETELMLQAHNHVLSRYQILQIYMVTGGIPYYLQHLDSSKSAVQNINDLCFRSTSFLRSEFRQLFKSLFKKAEVHEAIISALSTKTSGLTRKEILEITKLSNGGRITRILSELMESGFIQDVQPISNKSRQTIYRLSDFYSLFYLKFIQSSNPMDDNIWINMIDSPTVRAWQGYAFEQVCMYHLPQIKKSLGISGIQSRSASWKSNDSTKGAQIDLVIDRRDQVINICEMKYSINPYTITKDYDAKLRDKIGVFKSATKTRKALHLTMITTFGLAENKYFHTAQQNLTMEVLFEKL